MHPTARALLTLFALSVPNAETAAAQSFSVTGAVGPVLLPGARPGTDWAALLALSVEPDAFGGRLEAMYTGVPGADLLALTGNLVWTAPGDRLRAIEPYLVAGVGTYVKFSEAQFGLNGGVGVRRRTGPVRFFVEMRYHRVTRRFEEASAADTFIPVSLGLTW